MARRKYNELLPRFVTSQIQINPTTGNMQQKNAEKQRFLILFLCSHLHLKSRARKLVATESCVSASTQIWHFQNYIKRICGVFNTENSQTHSGNTCLTNIYH